MVLCQFSVSSPLFPTGLPLRQQGLRHLEVAPTGHIMQRRAAVQVLARSKGWVGTDGVQKQVENDGDWMNIFTKTGEKKKPVHMGICKLGMLPNKFGLNRSGLGWFHVVCWYWYILVHSILNLNSSISYGPSQSPSEVDRTSCRNSAHGASSFCCLGEKAGVAEPSCKMPQTFRTPESVWHSPGHHPKCLNSASHFFTHSKQQLQQREKALFRSSQDARCQAVHLSFSMAALKAFIQTFFRMLTSTLTWFPHSSPKDANDVSRHAVCKAVCPARSRAFIRVKASRSFQWLKGLKGCWDVRFHPSLS